MSKKHTLHMLSDVSVGVRQCSLAVASRRRPIPRGLSEVREWPWQGTVGRESSRRKTLALGHAPPLYSWDSEGAGCLEVPG